MAHAHSPLLFIISEPVGSPIANEVAYRLADQGVRTWIGSLAPTGELSENAMAALRASVATLLIFDQAAAGSREVDRHLLVARQTGKPLIPLRVHAADEGLLRQELLDARWIDWNAPDQAIAEIRRRAYDYDPTQRGDGAPVPPITPERSKPRIEVLQAGPVAGAAAAATAAPAMASASAHGAGAEHYRSAPPPLPVHPGAAEPRRRSPFASPTMLLALLALAVIVGAILYNSSLFSGDSDREEREVASRTQVSPAPMDSPDYAEATPAPDLAPAAPQPAAPAATPAEEVPAATPATLPTTRPAQPVQPAAPAPNPAAAADAPEPAEPAAEPSAGQGSAVAAVRSFYSALSGGNGAAAAQLVIPAKRASGPLSAGALSRYYSSFRRPLRVRSVTPVNANTVRVSYDYVLADGRLCEGAATVNTVQSGDRSLVSSIRTQGAC